ncbi:sulfatase [Pontiella agarivorans]|uniref:Sulfatase n=1 Tax=Pontiella agarivorans TaxID=3038953 RepID=A0ABU5MXZ0_9BACT|nr:sulfatase [Pontiella agarivorans]MDZ8119058.1 sulfatase [Pontiella agarivorans]
MKPGYTLVALCLICTSSLASRPNILFIAIDDLRPELNCYGATQIISPNIDQLAERGLVFNRAYCNVPVCGASRASLLTGLHPLPDRFTTYGSRVDEDAAGIVTLPQHFKENGYYTAGVGKLFHHPDDGLKSWTVLPVRPDYPNDLAVQEEWRDYRSAEYVGLHELERPGGAVGPAWEAADVEDDAYYDGKTTTLALSRLEIMANQDKPFFLGVGFIRPHLPFNVPKKYWDLYPEESITLADNPTMPEGAPKEADFNSGELRSYSNIPRGKNELVLDPETAKNLRRGYYACVSYVDTQIGKIMKKLNALGLADNTIIIVWGDHGWSLGEHSHWGKHTCFNNAVQTPLIMHVPGGVSGKKSESLIEFVDLYPTLCDLAGLQKPDHLQGRSLVPVLNDPEAQVNDYVFARWHNGETIVSSRFNYTEYYNKNGKMISNMLYDRFKDPEENVNIVNNPEYKSIVNKLSAALEKHISERR